MKEEHPLLQYFGQDKGHHKSKNKNNFFLFVNILIFFSLLIVFLLIFTDIINVNTLKFNLTSVFNQFSSSQKINTSKNLPPTPTTEVKGEPVNDSTISGSIQEPQEKKDFIPGDIYRNSLYKYSLTLPQNWVGKYEILGDDKTVAFIYNVNPKMKEPVFTIFTISKKDWEALKMTPVYHGDKIGEQGETVFIYTHRLDNPYSATESAEFKKLTDEYHEMFTDIPQIISTFKFD